MNTLVDLAEWAAGQYARREAFLFRPGFRTRRWSHAEVWEHSGKVASFLAASGVDPGDRVALWAPNMPEWCFSLLGTLRAGAVGVPLDLRSEPDFVSTVVKQTSPKLAFISRVTPADGVLAGLRTVYLEDLHQTVADAPPPPYREILPDDLAEIVFTSGTTGNPKGVMLTHGNILAGVESTERLVPRDRADRLLSILPLSHMLEQAGGLFGTLRYGYTVVYPVSRQPTVLLRTMVEHKVTTILAVPQIAQLFMSGIEREAEASGRQGAWRALNTLAARLPLEARRVLFRSVHARFGGALRYLITGGAYLDPALAEKWERLGVLVLQGYGATEASPTISCNDYRQRNLDSLGRVLPGQQVRIAQDGEILVKGPNITPGYWNNPEATAAAFEDGWYKTGDLGAMDGAGFLFFKGRKKDLIVLANGQNVYPDDIEHALRQQPGVKDAAVVGLAKEGGAVEVHAVLLLAEDADPRQAVREANRDLAPHQQVSGHTVWPHDDFPRTHTLKVKKAEVLGFLISKVSEPAANQPESVVPDEPASPLLRIVATLCERPLSDLTPQAQLGEDLGLDSLGRVELLSSIEADLGVYLEDTALGPETTLEELEHLVATTGVRSAPVFMRWPLNPLVRAFGELVHQLFIIPVYRMVYELHFVGREHLKGLGQAIFAANHNVNWDPPLVYIGLGSARRRRLAIAAADDDVFGVPWKAALGPLIANAFPISREANVRTSLEYIGKLLDLGWSIQIFPEGQMTEGGPIQTFKAGTGLLALDAGVPVVPVRIDLERPSWLFQRVPFPQRGRVIVRYGAPLVFKPGTAYLEATERIEAAVRAL